MNASPTGTPRLAGARATGPIVYANWVRATLPDPFPKLSAGHSEPRVTDCQCAGSPGRQPLSLRI